MKKNFWLLVLIAFAFVGFQSCGEAPKEDATTQEAAPTVDTTQAVPANAGTEQAAVEQLAAFYNGTLPCDNCDGIQTMLTLNADEQRSYTMEEEYQGKQPKKVESKGTWSVAGTVVTLKGEAGETKYQVTSDGLLGMNADGSVKDATKYLLKKVQGE